MEHVARLELACGRGQDVPPRQLRRGMDQRHHVLQLVAEAKRAAGLIESRTAPDAARQALVQQPAIQQQIHGGIRCVDLHRTE